MVAGLSGRVTFALILAFAGGGAVWGQCTGTNPLSCTSGSITVNIPASGNTPTKASPYPSQVNFTGSGAVGSISVTLNGFTYNEVDGADRGLADLAILLVAPDGTHNLNILSFPDGDTGNFTKVTSPTTLTLSDRSPASYLPCTAGFGSPPFSYNPTSLSRGGNQSPSFPNVGLTVTFSQAGSTSEPGCPESALGTSTFKSAFVDTGTQANGLWSLYVYDDNSNDVVSFTSWTLTITTNPASTTTTGITTSANPSLTGNLVTFTATVTNTSGVGGTPTGTVTFKNGSNTITCSGGNQGVDPSGNATFTCPTTFNAEGFQSISATYVPSGNFDPSSGSLLQYVRRATTNPSGTTFCNAGALTIGGSPNASGTDSQPYPSVINVTGIGNAVNTVQLSFTGFSASSLEDIQMLLVSPDRNHALNFFDDIGGGAGSGSANFTVADNGSSGRMPQGSGSIANGATYEPTSYASSATFPSIPGLSSATGLQVPGSFSMAGPGGAATFLSSFNNATANGNWTLYFYDNASSTASITGGWCLTITPGTGVPTTTTVSGSPNAGEPNGATVGSTVTVTASVVNANNSTAVNTGSVVFTDNGAPVAGGPAGAVSVGTSGPNQGKASFTTSSLTEGDHTITATYSDGASFSESFGTYVQRVDHATTGPTVNGSTITYCNPGTITIPAGAAPLDLGRGTPNPSNINVTNLYGTIHSVTVSLNGFTYNDPNLLRSLLVSPTDTAAASFDFFSAVGGNSAVNNLNLMFADSGTGFVGGSLVSGTFKPSSDGGTSNTYTASSSGFYTLPTGAYSYAASSGTSTFGSVYGSSNGNGLWSLYFNQTAQDNGGTISGGWCLNFTENAPTLSITKSHSGNFTQGQKSAAFTVIVTNNGPGSAGGASGITVTDNLPAGLTPSATPGSGTDWICNSSSTTITCTNSDLIGSGNTYPTLTLFADVASNAGSPLSNTASVSGSGTTTPVNSSPDSITVTAAPILSIAKAHTGNFTQGSTGVWTITVGNGGSASSTTSGTTTVLDTFPTGYSLASFSGTGWACSGTTSVMCTSTGTISGGSSFPALSLTVSVPANSPTSVSNTATAYGGGDPNHGSSGTAVSSNSDSVTVNQVPSTISASSGSGQAVAEGAAFSTLQATVLDANNQPINGVTVTFTAPASGASVVFAGTNTNTATGTTNAAGVATSPVPTANNNSGNYSVTANVTPSLPTAASFSLTNNAPSGPTVVSYNVLFGSQIYNVTGSARNRLPWQITGIQVVFSSTVTGNANSLSGVTVTNFSGNGTNTLTWTINPISLGSYSTTLAGSGPNAIQDSGNHGLNSGAGASQTLRVLWGDANDDGVVNAQDIVLVNNARNASYNIFADMNGDGVVDVNDVNIVRSKQGTKLP